MYFTVVTEGSFPFRDKKNWPKKVEKEKEPINFYPTLETLLSPSEWRLFDFSPEEEKNVLIKHGLQKLPMHVPAKEKETTIDVKHEDKQLLPQLF